MQKKRMLLKRIMSLKLLQAPVKQGFDTYTYVHIFIACQSFFQVYAIILHYAVKQEHL